MIFDSGHKAILKLQYSDEFNSKHSFHELLGKVRQRDLVTIRGRFHLNPNRGLVFVAEDIHFVQAVR